MKRRLVAIGLAAALLGFAGCGKRAKSPTAPPAPSAPEIVSVSPAPRTVKVPLEVRIEVELRDPADPATLGPTNLFLKLDTRRYDVDVTWNEADRRIVIVPRAPLTPGRTYTVEITPRVRLRDGRPVAPAGYFWQFRSTSVRPILTARPPDRATLESTFVRLGWDSTETAAGSIRYAIWWSDDSAAVAERRFAPVYSAASEWIPQAAWGLGRTLFWSARVENLTTGDTEDGPVWAFTTLPEGTPLDSVLIPLEQWGSTNFGLNFCYGNNLYAGPDNYGSLLWPVPGEWTTIRLAGVRWVVTGPTFNAQLQATIRPLADLTWNPCAILPGRGPRVIETPLAIARLGSRTNEYVFSSDYWAAHWEASARNGAMAGYSLRTLAPATFAVSSVTPNIGALRVYFYRMP